MENKTPQLEYGYTRIANEILDRLATYRISGEEWMILLTILRKTYGFDKKEDKISISQFYKATGLAKPSICRAINKLVKKNVINKKATAFITIYSFNKLYNTWKPSYKKATPVTKLLIASRFFVNKRLQKSDIQKKKETSTKEILSPLFKNPEYLLNIPVEDLDMLKKNINVNNLDIKRKGEEIYNWTMSAKKNRRDNYKLVLRNALIKDFKYTYKT